MIAKLPYLKKLGVDFIWLNPVFKSPNKDNGYDISDYQDINLEYGTLDDVRELVDKAHALGLKVLFDLVVNHTSDKHPWFCESRSSKDNPYRDFYHWVEGNKGCPPNNWKSFRGSRLGLTMKRRRAITCISLTRVSQTSTGKIPSSDRQSTT